MMFSTKLSRRLVLALPALAALPAQASAALSERFIGSADAPITVAEYFSLTCPHCARFSRDTLPQINEQLIKTGKVRWIFRDFPLDKTALMAALVARALPPERYEPFVSALLASQDRWLYARGVDPRAEIAKMSLLAGLNRAAFDKAADDTAARDAILADQENAEKTYGVDSTPTFIINGPKAKNRRESGELNFAQFSAIIAQVG